jgi:hypothetical protein
MARSNYNVITYGLSGKVGDLVLFKQWFGKTIMSKIPVRTAAFTTGQLAIQEKFKQAARYAKNAIKEAATKALYLLKAGGGVQPFNLALADYFSAPEIDQVITNSYSGAVGSLIEVQATDDTKVTEVNVSIRAANGTLIEQGPATLDETTGRWNYTTVTNASAAGGKIIVTAKDLPGNTTTVEKQV